MQPIISIALHTEFVVDPQVLTIVRGSVGLVSHSIAYTRLRDIESGRDTDREIDLSTDRDRSAGTQTVDGMNTHLKAGCLKVHGLVGCV